MIYECTPQVSSQSSPGSHLRLSPTNSEEDVGLPADSDTDAAANSLRKASLRVNLKLIRVSTYGRRVNIRGVCILPPVRHKGTQNQHACASSGVLKRSVTADYHDHERSCSMRSASWRATAERESRQAVTMACSLHRPPPRTCAT